jgi:hypothetical protein
MERARLRFGVSVYTLCAAAFFHYPESVQNVAVAVNLHK